MDEEQSFRDDKSSGFDWDASRVRNPAHMARLLLVLQLAACFVLAQGVFVLHHGLRHVLERPDRRTLSLFSLGLRWLDRARLHFVPLSLAFPFPSPDLRNCRDVSPCAGEGLGERAPFLDWMLQLERRYPVFHPVRRATACLNERGW